MSTLDVVNQVGGKAANFLDIGGGANADVMAAALDVINPDENVRSIFINIFGGITRGEEVAKGIVEALGRVELRAPIVIRLDGTNAEEGRQIILDAGIPAAQLISKPTMLEAAREAVAIANGSEGGSAEMADLRRRRHQGHRPGPDRRAGQVPRPAQPGLRHPGRRRRDARQGRPGRRGHPGVRHRGRGGRGHRRDGVVRRRAAEGGAGGDPRGRRGRHRLRRVHHRGHPGPGRGARLQHAAAGLPGHPPARARTARASSARASATSASRRATSPSCRPPTAPTSASSAAPAR